MWEEGRATHCGIALDALAQPSKDSSHIPLAEFEGRQMILFTCVACDGRPRTTTLADKTHKQLEVVVVRGGGGGGRWVSGW
jgi:hypothetical protein